MTSAEPSTTADCYALLLLPDERLAEQIESVKQAVARKVGPQRYLDHPPHITLTKSCFRQRSEMTHCLSQWLAQTTFPRLQTAGWHLFEADPLTGESTIVCTLNASSTQTLRHLQTTLLEAVAGQRDRQASLELYTAAWDRLSPLRQQSIETWGFPYTGDDWIPHLTIASLPPSAASIAWPMVQEFSITNDFSLTSLHIIRLELEAMAESQALAIPRAM